VTYLAIILAAGYPLLVLGFLTYCRTLVRPYQRREDDWADRVMLMAGTPWRTPNVQVAEEEQPAYSFSPEQEPDFSLVPE
jgi:hypothetical protein